MVGAIGLGIRSAQRAACSPVSPLSLSLPKFLDSCGSDFRAHCKVATLSRCLSHSTISGTEMVGAIGLEPMTSAV